MRLFKPEVLLAVVENNFDAPAAGIPGNHLLGGRFVAGRIMRLLPASAGKRLDQWSPGRLVNMRITIGNASRFSTPMNVVNDTTTTLFKHPSRLVRAKLDGKQFKTLRPP
ncbi:hypothetical protein [Bythopirellula goksoeyrii]|uniref:hypothetical protein n=1 Tax=Bythopirellula goksoeyrii TaxID=1400387 RepID=UPI0011CD53F8|nr:hypothetical protein [Bythopirellula goksoeyrii]